MTATRVLVALSLACLGGPAVAQQRADAVVLVNSQSASYGDAATFIRPYLDHLGVPYAVLDIATTPVTSSIGNYALIVVGHRQLDVSGTYLGIAGQSYLANAVAAGAGLVSFDSDLSANGVSPRYAFVDAIFGFSYRAGGTATGVTFTGAAPGHYVSSRHAAGQSIAANADATMATPGFRISRGGTALAVFTQDSAPLLAVTQYGNGRAVQWGGYAWMSHFVLGPLSGLDDLVWRGFAWAARKPFVMRLLPPLATMRIDDVSGNGLTRDSLWWLRTAVTETPFRPWAGTFYSQLPSADADYLGTLARAGLVTTSVHSGFDGANFYYDLLNHTQLSDTQVAANYSDATAWHRQHGVPISKYVIPHAYGLGANALAGLQSWGVEFTGLMVAPGSYYFSSPWLTGAPFRLYESDLASLRYNLTYADYVPVGSQTQFTNAFFNCVTEMRSGTGYEWYPDGDVNATIGRGVLQLKQAMDSMAVATLFTHENYIQQIAPATFSAELRGVAAGIAPYAPQYVTMDDACRYLRAKHNTAITSATYDALSRTLTANLAGSADVPTQLYVFTGSDDTIAQTPVTIPAFSTSTQVLKQLPGPVAYVTVTPSPATVAAGGRVTFTAQAFDLAGRRVDGLTFRWSAAASAGTIDQAGVFTAGASAGTYANAVTATVGVFSASASVSVYAATATHFLFSSIGGVTAGTPFPVTITTYDQYGALLTSFGGTAQLADRTGTVAPAVTGSFSGGSWTGTLTIGRATSGDVITATSGAASGLSAAFDVVAAPPHRSLWEATDAPARADGGASTDPVEVGVKFRSDVDGYVTAIRFYKASTNTGTHVGNLWSSTGARLASATFTNETASGWQEVALPTPVAITAGTLYIVSYGTTVGHYSADAGYFATAGQDSAPLHAPASGGADGGNGVYAYGPVGTFPSSTYGATNYWVDVAFEGSVPTRTLTAIAITPAAATVAVGGTQQFAATGTYSDGTTQDLSAGVTWASSSGVASITAAGTATGLVQGSATISATVGAVSGSATLNVFAPTVARRLALVSDDGDGLSSNGRLDLFFLDGNGGVATKWKTTATGSWSTLSLGGFGKQLAAARDLDGRLEVFYAGGDDAVWMNWQTTAAGAPWHGESRLGGSVAQLAAARNADGRLEIFYVGTDLSIRHDWQTSAGSGWYGDVALGGYGKQVVAARNADGRLQVFYVGTDDSVWTNAQTAPNSGWAGPTRLGGRARQLAVSRNADGRLDVFYIGWDGTIWHNWQNTANGSWHGEASVGGKAKQLTVTRNTDGRLELFYVGKDDAIWHRAQTAANGAFGAEARLGGVATQVVVGRNSDGRLEVFYLGSDGVIRHNWQTSVNGAWAGEAPL